MSYGHSTAACTFYQGLYDTDARLNVTPAPAAIDPEKLKSSPASLKKLKNNILKDAQGEGWLRGLACLSGGPLCRQPGIDTTAEIHQTSSFKYKHFHRLVIGANNHVPAVWRKRHCVNPHESQESLV